MSHSQVLQNVYLFKTMTDQERTKIANILSNETFAPGDEIFTQGEKAFAMYFVKFGSVKINQRTENGEMIQIATLGTGSHFGELAFLDGQARSASSIATERAEILVLSFESLNKLLATEPGIAVKLYKELALFLAGRLRITTTDLSFSREKNLSHF